MPPPLSARVRALDARTKQRVDQLLDRLDAIPTHDLSVFFSAVLALALLGASVPLLVVDRADLATPYLWGFVSLAPLALLLFGRRAPNL